MGDGREAGTETGRKEEISKKRSWRTEQNGAGRRSRNERGLGSLVERPLIREVSATLPKETRSDIRSSKLGSVIMAGCPREAGRRGAERGGGDIGEREATEGRKREGRKREGKDDLRGRGTDSRSCAGFVVGRAGARNLEGTEGGGKGGKRGALSEVTLQWSVGQSSSGLSFVRFLTSYFFFSLFLAVSLPRLGRYQLT